MNEWVEHKKWDRDTVDKYLFVYLKRLLSIILLISVSDCSSCVCSFDDDNNRFVYHICLFGFPICFGSLNILMWCLFK